MGAHKMDGAALIQPIVQRISRLVVRTGAERIRQDVVQIPVRAHQTAVIAPTHLVEAGLLKPALSKLQTRPAIPSQ